VPTDPTGSIEAVAAAAIPSIVTVQISDELEDGPLPVGSGSGVVFSDDGYILTNDHVIRDAELIEIIFPTGRVYPADVVGTDPLTDIAVVKIETEGLVPIPLAEIADVSIGDLAIAVGNPLGLQGGPSVTSGVVSAFERTLQVSAGQDGRLYGLIQTDAPITRGSSGGALLDETGRLVGVTTAIGVSDVGAEGLGFAVPVDTVSLVVDDLIADGEVRHAFLGISGDTAFQEAADGADVPIGASIVGLEDEAAIGLAGAQVGDVIRSVDGVPVTTIDQLISLLRKRRAGQTVSVDLLRGAQELTVDVRLDVRPESP
jgi:S1-C subfamily serine protease